MESNYIEDFLVNELLGADALKFNAGMKQILSYSLLERIGNKIQICEVTQRLIRAAMSKKALNEVKLKIGELLSKIFSEILNSSYCILSCSRRSELPTYSQTIIKIYTVYTVPYIRLIFTNLRATMRNLLKDLTRSETY